MEGGIQQADGDGQALHGLEDALKVAPLHGQNLVQGLLPLLGGGGHDHLTDGGDTVLGEEHMLGTGQAHALRAEVQGHPCVMGVVGVGADGHLAVLIGPLHNGGEVAGDAGLLGGQLAQVDVAGGAVQGEEVPLADGDAAQYGGLGVLVHHQVGDAGHAAAAHTTGHHGGVGGAAAAGGQHALGHLHTHNVLRGGLLAHQHHGAVLGVGLAVLSGEVGRAAARAGGGGDAGGDGGGLSQGVLGEVVVEDGVQALRLQHQQSLLLGDQPFLHQVHGDFQRRAGGALAVPGLEHIEVAPLDGELHVLHIPIVVLQPGGDVHELVIDGGVDLLQLGDVGGAADAGHHVLALGVHQEVAIQLLLAGDGVTGEGHTGAGVVTPVAEHHGLHVDGGAPGVGDVVLGPVVDGPLVVPGAEHGLDSLHQLHLGLLGEVLPLLGAVIFLKPGHQLLHILGGQLAVQGHAPLCLDLVNDALKVALIQLHHHVGEHLDEPTVGVVYKAGVVCQLHQALGHGVVDAQVQDGVHHAGHGGPCAGTDGDQQGILRVAEALGVLLLQNGQLVQNFLLYVGVDGLAVLIVLGAGFRGDGEALGDGHPGVGHLRQVGAFAAQQLPHILVALREQIDEFFAHTFMLLFYTAAIPPGGRSDSQANCLRRMSLPQYYSKYF